MKTISMTVVLALALLAASSVQAFCFLKNNSRDRQSDFYQYRVPAGHAMPRQARHYPFNSVPVPVWYDQGIPAIMPEPQASPPRQEWYDSY